MKPIITIILLLFSFLCFAQKQNVYFLKNNGRYVSTRDSADYIRVVQEPDSGSVLYKVFEYYANGTKRLAGLSSTIDPPIYEGLCLTYYKTGIKKAVNNYKKSLPAGNQYFYYPNGSLYCITKYPDSVKVGHIFNNYLIMAENDSLGVPMVTDGNGYFKEYDAHFKKIKEEGKVINGVKDSVWRGYDNYLHIRFVETYDNGKLLTGISVGEKGDTLNYSNSRTTEPEYKGGLQAFYEYVAKHVKYPSYEKYNDIQGKVFLSFLIEKDGKISDIKILHSVSHNIDEEAERVLKNSPDWIPGTAYGRKIGVYYQIPLNFTLRN